jgi:hypothetical protein
MKLGLIKCEQENGLYENTKAESIKFNFFKDSIKKDLDVVAWQNKAVKVFGDFQIYSDFQLELNSFDHIISFELGNDFDRAGDSLEAVVACRCPDHFLKLLVLKNFIFTKNDIDILSEKYTLYLVEAVEVLKNNLSLNIKEELDSLDKKYFDGEDPSLWKYLDPKFLN